MEKYLLETIERLEKIVVGFERKHGEKAEVMYMCDVRRAIEVLQEIIKKYK